MIFTLKVQRSPWWFPRSAPLVEHTQPETLLSISQSLKEEATPESRAPERPYTRT